MKVQELLREVPKMRCRRRRKRRGKRRRRRKEEIGFPFAKGIGHALRGRPRVCVSGGQTWSRP